MTGIQRLNPEEFPGEYYRLTVVSRSTGLSATHLRKCRIRKFRFGNADYVRVVEVNSYLENGDGAD